MPHSALEWRFGRGWTTQELEQRLAPLGPRGGAAADEDVDPAHGEGRHFTEGLVALESQGPPATGGPFERARPMVEEYRFSDPRIVAGHFDPQAPLLGRPMLLEIQVLGLHYLCAVRVSAVRDERGADESVFGFRYHTVPPHIESGAEWFLLRKRHDTGEVRFRIEATWRPGQFPNWWSRLGFGLLARRRQREWHRRAHLRLRRFVGAGA